MKTLPLSALATLLALAACNQSEPEEVGGIPDPMASALANAAPVELPPAIKADVTFRCKDNSLVYVTFFQGDKLAAIRSERGGPATRLTAPEAGQPRTAEGGWSLTGDEENITLEQPGKDTLTCRA